MTPPRTPLGAKLAIALLAVAVAALLLLLLGFGPRARRSFVQRSGVLTAQSAVAMRAQARAAAARSREVLTDLIAHTADARRRVIADLPLDLYRGDLSRIRAAIEREAEARDARHRANVAVLSREMESRTLRRIQGLVTDLAEQQRELGMAFAREVRNDSLLLLGVVFAVLLGALGIGLWRTVVRPVRALRTATRAVTGGDLEVGVPVRSRDELGDLAADFAVMVRELRESRDALRRSHEDLESDVARKTEHLRRALAELQSTQRQLVHAAKMASLGTLAGGVAHEFNNLVGGIRGCAAELLADERDAGRREALEVVVRTADRAAAITEQLLQFARRRVGEKSECDLVALVGDALQLVEPRARAQGVAVERRLPAALPVVADAGGMHQVLLNLVTNAVQAMPEGGRLTVEGGREGGEVVVRVRDTGTGIDAGDLARIFDPFFTTKDTAPDPAGRGIGLGLSVSHGVVEAHGGTLEAASEPTGAVFTVRLPAGPAAP